MLVSHGWCKPSPSIDYNYLACHSQIVLYTPYRAIPHELTELPVDRGVGLWHHYTDIAAKYSKYNLQRWIAFKCFFHWHSWITAVLLFPGLAASCNCNLWCNLQLFTSVFDMHTSTPGSTLRCTSSSEHNRFSVDY